MNASFPEFRQALDSLQSLTEALGDQRVGMAVVRRSGQWHQQRDGAMRRSDTPLSSDVTAVMVRAVHEYGPMCCLDRWWVRPVDGGNRRAVVFEKRPCPDPEGLSDRAVDLLRSRLRPGANGMIFGNSQSARSGVLLSLLRFLPGEFAVYVGPVPPLCADESSLLHVPTPRNDRDRRQLAMIAERASTVLFDGPVRPADMRVLCAGETTTDRWIAVDAPVPRDGELSLEVPGAVEASLDTRIGVRGSPVQSIRLSYLAVQRDDDWDVLLDQDDLHDRGNSDSETGADVSNSQAVAVTDPDDRSASSSSRDTATTNPETPSTVRRPDDQSTGLSRESGEIDVPGFRAEHRPEIDEGGSKTSDVSTESSPTDALKGERIDDELPGLIASRDVDDVEIPDLDPRQLRQTFEGDVDVDSFRAVRGQQRKKTRSDDTANENNPQLSGRQLERGSQLGAESSATLQQDSSAASEDWQRNSSSGHRVIPVPTGGGDVEGAREQPGELGRFESQTEELGISDQIPEVADEQSEPETDELIAAPKKAAPTEVGAADSEPETMRITVDDSDCDESDSDRGEAEAGWTESIPENDEATEELDLDDILDDLQDQTSNETVEDEPG